MYSQFGSTDIFTRQQTTGWSCNGYVSICILHLSDIMLITVDIS